MNTIYYLNEERKKSDPTTLFNELNSSNLTPYELEEENNQVDIKSLLLYDESHLYLFVMTTQKQLVSRDRAYQNGDGFHFVLAKPQKNNEPTDEFYVIGISPRDKTFRRHFVWYRNIDLDMTDLKKTEVEVSDKENIYIRVKIPWEEIHPFKGLLLDDIGFNIGYVQTTNENKNSYMLEKDGYIDSEQKRRKYQVLEFEKPVNGSDFSYQVDLKPRHCDLNESVKLLLGAICKNQETIHLQIKSNDICLLDNTYKIKKGLTRYQFYLETKKLKEGRHLLTISLKFKDHTFEKEFYLNIYNKNELTELNENIKQLGITTNTFMKESMYTIQYFYQSMTRTFDQLKWYDDYQMIDSMKKQIEDAVRKVQEDKDLFNKGEVIRLAHLNSDDASLQPYSLYIPKTFKEKKKKKLLVFLHGSGSDDTSVKSSKNLLDLAEEENMIILAPFARGTSHFYCPENARNDIKILTNKMIKLFNIEKENVLLSGFSMGGYGVYRLFHDAPSLYKGLVVISGHHKLGSYFGGYDYGLEEYITIFKDVPMIIFHGKKDKNCAYNDVKIFFEKIKHINQNVEIYYAENEGHCGLIDAWVKPLKVWLKRNI